MHTEDDKPDISRREFMATGGLAAVGSVLASRAAAAEATGDSSNSASLSDSGRAASEADGVDDDCVVASAQQYKRWGRSQMAKIEDGELDRAEECLHAALTRFPGDPEFYHLLAAVHAGKGEMAQSIDYVRRALDAGMPIERFLAGPRPAFGPLLESETFRRWAAEIGSELIHGPLLGSVTDRQARFWVRSWHEVPVVVSVRRADGTGRIRMSGEAKTNADRDYTAVVTVNNLEPATEYLYHLELDGKQLTEQWTFSTFPPDGENGVFEIGFGGCAGYTPWHERIWRRIAARRFPLFLLTGDNVYHDDPTRPQVQDYCYYRRQSRPEFRALTAGTSIAAIWDDHDFGDDDSIGGPEIDQPAWKIPVWKTFRNNWNNPSYGGGEERPGCWFDFSIGDVDIIMLDDRYYRTEGGKEGATMLGPVQKQWLYDRLLAARGTFKLVVTSVPWAYGVKPGSNDPWHGYLKERDEIFGFLSDHKIDGVVLLSGDRHRADVWRIERPNAYPLYDFENARLTNLHTHPVLGGALYGYNEKCTYGRLRFDTTKADPEVAYDIITIDDEVVYTHEVKRSEISHS